MTIPITLVAVAADLLHWLIDFEIHGMCSCPMHAVSNPII